MNNMFEVALTVISAAFVLVTATLDPQAAMVVAVVAILCFVGYRVFFAQLIADDKKVVKSVVKKSVAKRLRQQRNLLRKESRLG